MFTHARPWSPPGIADLDALLTALYMELTDRIIPYQSEYNQRLKAAVPLTEAALRWLAEVTPGSAEMLRLMDATPVPCGHSVITAKRSDLYGWAGYGYRPSHSRWY